MDGNAIRQSYYLRIDTFGVFACDSKTNRELLAVSYIEGKVDKAIDAIKANLSDARLVGARFPNAR